MYKFIYIISSNTNIAKVFVQNNLKKLVWADININIDLLNYHKKVNTFLTLKLRLSIIEFFILHNIFCPKLEFHLK